MVAAVRVGGRPQVALGPDPGGEPADAGAAPAEGPGRARRVPGAAPVAHHGAAAGAGAVR